MRVGWEGWAQGLLSAGSKPSSSDCNAHATHSVIYTHRELELSADEGGRMKGKMTSSLLEKTTA